MSSPEDILDGVVRYLTGNHPFAAENHSFWMAMQAALIIRNNLNKERKLNWFHAFVLTVATGFTGGWFGFMFMGLPSSMLSNDFNFGSCILAFFIINYSPGDIGYQVASTLPVQLVLTGFAQLFRSCAIARFADTCHNAFQDKPSPYYPIPVFGPILYATMLGNCAGFLLKGFNGYVENGMPWPMQNGFATASWYHFYVHDKTGPVGTLLRALCPITPDMLGVSDNVFGMAVVSLFMQIIGILQLPVFFGPTWSPFNAIYDLVVSTSIPSAPHVSQKVQSKAAAAATNISKSAPVAKNVTTVEDEGEVNGGGGGGGGANKKKKKKKKKQN